MRYKREFDNDEIVVINGRESSWHSWPAGTEVRIEKFDDSDNTYYCIAVDPKTKPYPESWVSARDIEEKRDDFVPVTDEEVAELFGLKPKRDPLKKKLSEWFG